MFMFQVTERNKQESENTSTKLRKEKKGGKKAGKRKGRKERN